MKRGGLGGAILLAAAVAFLALDREPPPARAPRTTATSAGEAPPPELPPDKVPAAEPAERGTRIVGRVTDEDGVALAGAEILVAERHLAGTVIARTGDDGRYVADGIEGKNLLVSAVAKGHAPSEPHAIGDAERAVREIDFTLRRGGSSLSLVIRTEDGGDPEAVVIVEPYFEHDAGRRRLVAQGGVTVEGLVPEWSRVLVLARGYAPAFLPVRLHPGGPLEAEVALERGATLVGTVRVESGAPVPDARVRAGVWDWRCFAKSDAVGEYRIDHLPAGRVDMEAEGDGGIAWAFLDLESGKESRWDPVLRTPGAISGRVIEEDGAPVARARVSCATRIEVVTAEADLLGQFRFERCGDAVHQLSAWRPETSRGPPAGETSALPGDAVTITLRRGEGHLRGTVVDRNGAPAAGARIRVWPVQRPDREVRALAAADGSFGAGPLPPGSYLVELHLDGEPTLHLRPGTEIVAGETRDLGVVRFPAGGRIRASVVDVAGGVLPDERIEIISRDGSVTFAGERDRGVLLSEELAAGEYVVRAAGLGLLEQVPVVAGGIAAVELRVRAGARLRFRPVLADGRPVVAAIRIEDAHGRVLRDYIYETVAFLAEGEWRVLAVDALGHRADTMIRVGREDRAIVLALE